MQIHELKNPHRRKEKKRIGRGGKRGTTSGKGQKGQKARSGHRIRPVEREVLSRIPKLRGVKNSSLKPKPEVVNVGELEFFCDAGKITKELLREKKLVKNAKSEIKILGKGDVKKAFIIEKIQTSMQAKEKIEKAGGRLE